MFEKLKQMREQVKEEMRHIHKGNESQNYLRLYYWPLRMASLGKKAKRQETKEEILTKCIERVKKEDKTFTPEFDRNYFTLI